MNINPFILVRENSLEKKSIDVTMDNSIYIQIQRSRLVITKLKDEIIKKLELFYKAEKDGVILEIKRNIYNDKIHKVNLNIELFHGKETTPVYVSLSAYLGKYQELESLEHEAENRYNRQLNKFRQSMIKLLIDKEEILSGLLMINPDIYYKLEAYINTPLDLHKSKNRKLESTLYKFISRAVLKTSPFLSITNVGMAKAQTNTKNSTHHENFSKHISLNYTFLYRLAFYYLINSNLFLRTIDFYLPPYSIRQEEGSFYISFLSRKDLPTNNKLYLPSENLGELKIPAILADLFESKDMDNNLTFEDFMGAFDHKISEENMYQIIRKYVNIGLLIPAVGFDEGSSELLLRDIKNTSQKYLVKDDFEKLNQFLTDIAEVSKKISLNDKYEAKHLLHRELAAVLLELEHETGITFPANSVFYEDGIIDEEQFIDQEKLDQSYIDFKRLQAFSLIFDANIRLQYEMGTKLYEHSRGQEMDIDSDFFSILFAVSKEMIPYWEDITYMKPAAETEEIRILDHLKVSFIQELRALCLGSSQKEIDIKVLIDKYINQIPEKIIKNADVTSSYFVQFNGDNIIVNSAYDGHEKFKARFMNYFTSYLSNDDKYLTFSEDYYDTQNYYEFTESFGFNGNVKKMKLKRECYTIGVGTKRFLPDAERLLTKVEDFKIKIDKENKKFRLIDMDKQTVKICFRGSLVPTSMPGYISVLLQLFSSGSMLFKFSELLEQDVMPRITYGKIVLNRQRIRLNSIGEQLKRRDGESSYQYYRRINMYFLESNLKKEFFIIAKRDFQFNDSYLRDFKPLYIDIANPIALRILEKEIISKSEMEIFNNFYIEEYLSNEGDYAKEYDIEVYKKEGEGIGEQLASL
ncbi:hypothetical protein M3650_11470 [Paenibacillus sp. MER TA 81-3]|uniref:hypothetical protein n=1 Tax=Paenibacillus sp. MER TA 81-3 TaxID=2939573 RepID=UPI00204074D3|nr:hypothetical protein [Paenibacillus sp. MER TA 81-3]MCM3339238.1 hypothetical protein [Paenibacillus sp. MER TA 81-3]